MFTLAPKDPFRNGRAIVADIVPSDYTEESLFLVHTDYGHTMKLTAGELRELYEIDKPMSFEAWSFERLTLAMQLMGPSVHKQELDANILLLEQRLDRITSRTEALRIKNPIKGEVLHDARIARGLLGKIVEKL